jgi:peptidoglycan/LPS O-acetylase OafA/YrhL
VHLADNFGNQYGWLPNTFVKEDIMSFFFVLSGFVTAYSHSADNGEKPKDRFHYLGRRFGKMLPPFLLSCVLDLPGAAITQYRPGCGLFWPACALQFFLLSPWTGLSHIARLNGVSWYLECLVWLWMAFAFLKVDLLFRDRPWRAVAGLYALSCVLFFVAGPLTEINKHGLPVLRLPEFCIGCCVASTLGSDRRLGQTIVWVVGVAFACYYVLHYIVFPEQMLMDTDVCLAWPVNDWAYRSVFLGQFYSKASMVWAVLIHCVARLELDGEDTFVLRCLTYPLFKTFNAFSMHMYLYHELVASSIMGVSGKLGVQWTLDLLILACYFISYLMFSVVHPVLHLCLGWVALQLPKMPGGSSPKHALLVSAHDRPVDVDSVPLEHDHEYVPHE